MKEDLGLKCDCGGNLTDRPYVTQEDACKYVNDLYPRMKKEKKAIIVIGLTIMGLMTPPFFVCEKCGRSSGFYETMGKALFQVAPLPQGAYARYADDKTKTPKYAKKSKTKDEKPIQKGLGGIFGNEDTTNVRDNYW